MSEVIVWNSYRLQVVNSHVHVQTSLDIVLRLSQLLELLSSPSQRIRQSFVFLRHPTSLDCSLLLLVAFILLIFTKQSGNRLNCLLRIDLSMVACWLLALVELRLRPISE